jgi:hypothetical protein
LETFVDKTKLRDSPHNLWFWGLITYHDVFDGRIRHSTRFCFRFVPGEGPYFEGPHNNCSSEVSALPPGLTAEGPAMAKSQGDTSQVDVHAETAGSESSSPSQPLAGPEIYQRPDTGTGHPGSYRKNDKAEEVKWLRRGVIANAVLSTLLFLATAVNGYFVCKQWGAMKDAQAATNQLVEQAGIQAAAAKQSAEAAAQANATTLQAMKLANRSWLAFGEIPKAPNLSNPARVTWNISYRNDGPATARNIWAKPAVALTTVRPRALTWVATDRKPEPSFLPALAPGSRAAKPASVDFREFDRKATAGYMHGSEFLTIQMLLDYADNFGETHVTSICVTYQRERAGWSMSMCPDGNYQN